jgi:hypothetical protein
MRSGGGQGDVSNLADVDRLFAARDATGSPSSSPTRASSRKISARWSSPRPIFDRLVGASTKGASFTLQRAAQHVGHNGTKP